MTRPRGRGELLRAAATFGMIACLPIAAASAATPALTTGGSDYCDAAKDDGLRAECRALLDQVMWLGEFEPSGATVRHAPDDPWIGRDKAMHYGVSALLTLSTQYVLVRQMDMTDERAWPVSAGTALAFGLFKEFADSQRPHQPLFSWRDMAWNAAGVATALAVILL